MDENEDFGIGGSGWFSPKGLSEAGGLSQEEAPDSGDIAKTRLAKNLDLQKQIRSQHALANDAVAHGMGTNAAQRWSGTPAIGLGMFKRRDPIFAVSGIGRTGEPRFSRRIDAGTTMATPPSGLIGGRALDNASRGIYGADGRPTAFAPKRDWDRMFAPKTNSAAPLVARNLGTQSAQSFDQTRDIA